MKTRLRLWMAAALVGAALAPGAAFASSHREAPITALDHKADITDLWAFVSYSGDQAPDTPPSKVTVILGVDPLLEPANGPTLFPFDPNVLYEIKIDNDQDARADITYQFRFSTELRLPGVPVAVAGVADGASDPETGALVVPPRIQGFEDPGLILRQTYTVTRINAKGRETQILNRDGSPFFVVPGNAGPRTMDYRKLFDSAIYGSLSASGTSVFAGTTDDSFWIDLGAAFDTLAFRTLGSGVPGVLTEAEDAAASNFASDTVSGYAVNTIAIEIPIERLTSTRRIEPASSPAATIGIWATTSRRALTVRRSPARELSTGQFRQVQRFGNPLINELVIGIGSKDRFSRDVPDRDAQFSQSFLNPVVVQVAEAVYGEFFPGAFDAPEGPRTDLLPLVTYAPPIAAPGTRSGPIADLMRLNTGVPATPPAQASRLGLIGGDRAGFPNGRRLFDDAVDIVLRVAVGGVLVPAFNVFPNNKLGDGVNVNDVEYLTRFPYVGYAPDGRNRRHIDPGETFPDGGRVPVE